MTKLTELDFKHMKSCGGAKQLNEDHIEVLATVTRGAFHLAILEALMIETSMQSSCTSLWGTSNPHLEVSWNYLFPGNYSIFIYSPHTDSKLYTDFLVMHSYLSGILQKQVTELMHSSTTLVCGIDLIL